VIIALFRFSEPEMLIWALTNRPHHTGAVKDAEQLKVKQVYEKVERIQKTELKIWKTWETRTEREREKKKIHSTV